MSLGDLLILLAIAAAFTPLEHLFPARRTPWNWGRVRIDILHLFVSGTLIRYGAALAVAGLVFVAGSRIPHDWTAAIRAQPDWLEFVEVLVLAELGFYAAHRLFHAVPWLWRFHEVHHSSEKLDWLATYRVHPVDQILNSLMIIGPAICLGFSGASVLAYSLIYRWHAVLVHSNVRVPFGPLKWIVASPHFHHWHHADQPEAYNRNFGGQLVLFDWLFGTLNMPAGERPARYGLTPPIPQTYLGQLAHPFVPPAGLAPPSTAPEHA
jgi:sterol desaturase/sphingolipid hydroxylase (fatty acid hydroxylase superfamily)